MATNTSQIASLLRPGLAAIVSKMPMYPTKWSDIYGVYESDKSFEQEVEMKMLGLGQIQAEGAPTAIDTMGQRIITIYQHRYVSLGFIITRQAIVDNLYPTRFPMYASSLRDSLAQSKEILGAALINNGFSASYPIGDGQPLFSTQHPIDGGVYANRPSIAQDLNEASLEAALIAISLFKNQAGLIVNTNAKKLIVPNQLAFTADRLINSAFRTNTNNNDISSIYNMSSIPEGARSTPFINYNNGNMWMITTDAPDGFKMYQREKLETQTIADYSTNNIQCKAFERYSFGITNPRAAYGSPGI